MGALAAVAARADEGTLPSTFAVAQSPSHRHPDVTLVHMQVDKALVGEMGCKVRPADATHRVTTCGSILAPVRCRTP